MDRTTIEDALDRGRLWAAMRNNRFWLLRRNGKTQTWKRDPQRFNPADIKRWLAGAQGLGGMHVSFSGRR